MSKLFRRKDFESQAISHLDSLYFVAFRLTGHREDADDLLQETYYKALNHHKQLKDLEKCKPWLYKIMVNIWKNWKIKRSRELFEDNWAQWESLMSQNASNTLQSHQMGPEENLMIKDLWRDVVSALAHLPSLYRMAVVLSDIEGFSYKEISEILEWPRGTVMSRLSRARKLLGRHLIKYKEQA